MHKRKIIVMLMAATVLFGSVNSNVCAKTLKESFSGWATVTSIDTHWFYGILFKKTAHAKTEGYTNEKKKHYVEAYIGGTSDSTKNAWANSGKKWAYGDVHAQCSSEQWDYYKGSANLFPTAYSKYGTK